MCYIDFSGERFPLRTDIELSDDLTKLVRFSAYIGNVDPDTGAPPRLPEDSIIIPEHPDDGSPSVPYVVIKRRLAPIEWTLAFSITAADTKRTN
jgi:hypothetical protein